MGTRHGQHVEDIKHVEQAHQRCLRKILGIIWKNRKTNLSWKGRVSQSWRHFWWPANFEGRDTHLSVSCLMKRWGSPDNISSQNSAIGLDRGREEMLRERIKHLTYIPHVHEQSRPQQEQVHASLMSLERTACNKEQVIRRQVSQVKRWCIILCRYIYMYMDVNKRPNI